MLFPATRRETRYGERIVRCFSDRPANMNDVFVSAAQRAPDRVALVCGDLRVTYRELDAKVERIARNLVHAGLKKGDRLALLLGNGVEFVYAMLAATRAGLISVPMNIRQKLPEVEFVLKQCGTSGIIYDAEYEANVPTRETVPTLRHIYAVGEGRGKSFTSLYADSEPAPFPGVTEEDTFCLLYTSGTTGKPKGAMLTHVSTIHSLLHYQGGFELADGATALLAVPASHVTGLVGIILTAIRVAGTTVIQRDFKARQFIELASQEKINFTIAVPAIYNLLLLDPDFTTFDLSAWRVAGFGGAPMPRATIERLANAVPNLILCNVYGSTETSSPVTMMPLGDINKAPNSVGKVLPCADIIVVDDEGREVPPGQSGELLIGGAVVVPSYWDNPAGAKAGFAMGYWVSGDIGSKDAEGFVYVFDRKKDMINRAGFKVYCIEVESTLAQIPGLVESAVVGKPDPVLGERVHAFLYGERTLGNETAIKQFCSERLSDYKVPDSVTFLKEPLPRNANGKVIKSELRALIAD
ncbi:class I adenylate-forming enzyme family protein [Chelatococcus reniformis]|uniref:O-succinylbenzoic acid--CoA ligase n=1 Tax=Chelatococcus reniformis TaxID=1494448 RepID=A0A916UPT0_9HYPH|nr:class I adenylate-forming enzyme family protein [Chelatococcus reniformis]GGC82291.1 O-succinylbenzoic acid--CoA ligase [Chelatococcus reniformis]